MKRVGPDWQPREIVIFCDDTSHDLNKPDLATLVSHQSALHEGWTLKPEGAGVDVQHLIHPANVDADPRVLRLKGAVAIRSKIQCQCGLSVVVAQRLGRGYLAMLEGSLNDEQHRATCQALSNMADTGVARLSLTGFGFIVGR